MATTLRIDEERSIETLAPTRINNLNGLVGLFVDEMVVAVERMETVKDPGALMCGQGGINAILQMELLVPKIKIEESLRRVMVFEKTFSLIYHS